MWEKCTIFGLSLNIFRMSFITSSSFFLINSWESRHVKEKTRCHQFFTIFYSRFCRLDNAIYYCKMGFAWLEKKWNLQSCLFLSTNNVLSAHTLQAHASHIGLRSLSGCWLIIVFRARVLLTEESGEWRVGMLMLMRRRRRRRYRYNNSVYISPLYRHQVTTHHHCNQSLLF